MPFKLKLIRTDCKIAYLYRWVSGKKVLVKEESAGKRVFDHLLHREKGGGDCEGGVEGAGAQMPAN